MKVQNDVARAPDERRVANIMIVKHVLIHEVLLLAWQLQGIQMLIQTLSCQICGL